MTPGEFLLGAFAAVWVWGYYALRTAGTRAGLVEKYPHAIWLYRVWPLTPLVYFTLAFLEWKERKYLEFTFWRLERGIRRVVIPTSPEHQEQLDAAIVRLRRALMARATEGDEDETN